MLEVHKINSDNVNSLEELYNEFKNSAQDYYKFDTSPLDFQQFKRGIIMEILKGYYATFDEKPIGFLFYVIEEHRAVEINILHINEEYRGEDVELEILETFLEDIKEVPGWDVISYPMLGGQANFVNKITHLGFKLVGQAIVRFKLTDIISPQIVTKLQLPELPEGYTIETWKPEHLEGASKVIYESFHTAPDAKFDPRFRTPEGCKKVVTMLVNSIMGDFLPNCTSVLIHEGQVAGICFANLTTQEMGNIPLIGLMPSAQGKGLSIQLLKQSIVNFITDVIEARLDCMEVNATVETDNFPALKMYRKIGFREDYNYPHAYMENEIKE
jgi:GNAT superfamily N-acetyltransferase